MTSLLSLRGQFPFILGGVLCSFVIMFLLSFKVRLLYSTFSHTNKIHVITSTLFTLFAGYNIAIGFYERYIGFIDKIHGITHFSVEYLEIIIRLLAIVGTTIALFAIFVFMYYFINRFFTALKDWVNNSDIIERRYLIICGTLMVIAIIIIFNLTNVFYAPNIDGKLINYDVVYTTDSANLVATNAYSNVNASENDIRNPLFGLFSMPFAIGALILSRVLFFIPNSYIIIVNIIQVLLLLVSIIIIARMLQLSGVSKIFLLVICTATYPVLLFSLNMEQYIFSLFWLIILLNTYLQKSENKDHYYIAATGSLLISGAMLPLLLESKSIKKSLNDLTSMGIKFFAIITLFGQLPLFMNAASSINRLTRFAGTTLPFSDRVLQYFNFISSCFVKPDAEVNTIAYSHASYQLAPVINLNTIGIILFLIAVLGYILNYRNRFAQICMWWVVFSFLILCVVGWGTLENGLILYTLYFLWAYVSLVFLAIEKLPSKLKIVRYSLYAMAAIALLIVNIEGIFEVIHFGINYYPIR